MAGSRLKFWPTCWPNTVLLEWSSPLCSSNVCSCSVCRSLADIAGVNRSLVTSKAWPLGHWWPIWKWPRSSLRLRLQLSRGRSLNGRRSFPGRSLEANRRPLAASRRHPVLMALLILNRLGLAQGFATSIGTLVPPGPSSVRPPAADQETGGPGLGLGISDKTIIPRKTE